VAEALQYHSVSSHHSPTKFARGGAMDWEHLPAKFLRFQGTPMLDLEDFSEPGKASRARSSSNASPSWLAQVLQEAFGLTAWRGQGGGQWALRANASSGALQPCEAYVLASEDAVPEWNGGGALFHYNPFWHALEVLCELPASLWASIEGQLPCGSALIAVTTIYWRNAWKYGDPGFRYTHQDVGHYIGALGFACAAEGARVALLEGLADDDIACLLGLRPGAPADDEQPQALLAVAPAGAGEIDARGFRAPWPLPVPFRNRAGCALRTGSHLSRANIQGHRACHKAFPLPPASPLWRSEPLRRPPVPCGNPEELQHCIRIRRSVRDYKVGRPLPLAHLWSVLRMTLPSSAPFDALPFSKPLVPMLLVFIHRVEGLAPGLYALCRDPSARPGWLRECAPQYEWQVVEAAKAAEIPLFRLQAPRDTRSMAESLSCGQDWAANGCAAFAILSEYAPLLREAGSWLYRRSHWEAGMIGQALYLGAESVGCGGTAMGCFFGPWTHKLLGIDGERLQDLEHFAFGHPLERERSRPTRPYAHLARLRALEDRDAVDSRSEEKALAQLRETTRGTCRGCGRVGAEGRLGTDDHRGQFFCGRCWTAWSPRARAAEAEEAKEDQEERRRMAGFM